MQPDPAQLLAYGVTLTDLVAGAGAQQRQRGAGYIERNGQQMLLRVPGQIGAGEQAIDDLRAHRGQERAAPRRSASRDVAQVTIGSELRTGAATQNGHEVVLGTVLMRVGENSRDGGAARWRQKLEEIDPTLPPGITVDTELRPHAAGRQDAATVQKNLRRRRAARDRGAVPAARQSARGAAHRDGDSARRC